MEIHAPHGRILTLKEALVQLTIVTAGILIALSLDGLLEWSHHRALLRETRQNLQNEIRNNQKDVNLVIERLDAMTPRFAHAIDALNDLSTPDHRKAAVELFTVENPGNLLKSFTVAWLNTASYSTAEVTGAFGLMDYDEVRRYAEIYDPQALYSNAQDAAQKEAMAAFLLGQAIISNPTPTEVADVKRQLRLAQARLLDMDRFATVLSERYASALKAIP